MIDNEGTRSLPQGGLEYAQLIYEVIVEGGATRLMPVFWYPFDDETDIPYIGPVRSARHYFLNFSSEHDALYVHIGQSPQAMRDFSRLRVDRVHSSRDLFWRITRIRGNWQDAYTSSGRIFSYVGDMDFRTATEAAPTLVYSETPVALGAGESARNVRITYSKGNATTEYEFDDVTGLYLRYRNGKPHMARETTANNNSSTQLTAKNILVQFVRNRSIDREDRQELDDVGSGEGYFITNGRAERITWSKASRTDPTMFKFLSGEPVLLNPGQTYIQIVPLNAAVELA